MKKSFVRNPHVHATLFGKLEVDEAYKSPKIQKNYEKDMEFFHL